VWFLAVLVLPCVVSRPSDSGEQLRESRTGPGFNVYHSDTSEEERTDRKVPVHIIFSDDINRNKSESTTLSQDQEQFTTSPNDVTTSIDLSDVTRESTVAAEQEKTEITLGDSNADKLAIPILAKNIHVRVKSPVEIFKSQDKFKFKENTNKQAVVDDTTNLEENTTTQVPDLFTNRQLTSPFENPFLSYLTKQQALERDNFQENLIQNRPQQQNVRREVFQQQTVINPNPYMQQFLQQMQQANQPQQFTQQFTYQIPPFPQTITNLQQPQMHFQQPQQAPLNQNNPNFPDTNRVEYPQQTSPNQDNIANMQTTLTLYPAIASVTYTVPANNQPNPNFQQTSQTLPNTRFIQPSSRVSWPLANYFPIVIKDPFLSMYSMMTNMVEYGPEADVCKKSKNFRQGRSKSEDPEDDEADRVVLIENGEWKILEKDMQTARKVPEENEQDRKKKDDSAEIVMETGGNGNAGPYITRLMVRKGGVSIAGPGGIATAGSGGTAIVGPGGVAYTSPNGLAVVGPGGKVVGVPSGTDLSVLASQMSNPAEPNKEGSTPRFVSSPKQWGYLTTNIIPHGLTTAPWTNHHHNHHEPSLNNLFLVFNGRLAAPKSLAKDNRYFYGLQPSSYQSNPVHTYHQYMVRNILNSDTTSDIHPITPSVLNSIQPISSPIHKRIQETASSIHSTIMQRTYRLK
ncbi:hypothetical protein L9F63_009935, partial [Diploptera punctata]